LSVILCPNLLPLRVSAVCCIHLSQFSVFSSVQAQRGSHCLFLPKTENSSRISDLNSIPESSDRRFHQYSCGCESDDDAPEVDTQWVTGQASRFSSPSTPLSRSISGVRASPPMRPDPGARTRRATRVLRIDRAASDRLPPREEYAVSLRRPAAAIGLQPARGLRRPQRCGEASQDPTFRLIGSEKIWDRGAALTSRLQSFETETLAEEENFAGLGRLNRALIGRAEATDSGYWTILDMDSTEVPVYGEQEQSAYNGYFESTCFSSSAPVQWGG
jgi:hypothetical protein